MIICFSTYPQQAKGGKKAKKIQGQAKKPLLAIFIDKYGVPTNQWTLLCEALLEVSMTKIALWIRVCADDWTAESAIKASNEEWLSVLCRVYVPSCFIFHFPTIFAHFGGQKLEPSESSSL